MGVRLTSPMTGQTKTLRDDEDEQTYRMLGWHDAIVVAEHDTAQPPAEGELQVQESADATPENQEG
jgi:hypothetical protein